MKGGVAKSTTTYNLAVGLARFHELKVLLVDIDPQGNSSASLGIRIWELEIQLKDALWRKLPLQKVSISVSSNLDCVPSNILLAEDEIPISGLPGRELLLRKALAPVQEKYDYVLIDCPPNIGVFSINALMASKELIIPVDMSYLGLLGISAIEKALDLVRSALEHSLEITGVLATRYDGRNNLSREVFNSLQEHFGDKMFKTVIPESVKVREAPSHALSIFDHAPNGKAAKAYRALVEEVISNENR